MRRERAVCYGCAAACPEEAVQMSLDCFPCGEKAAPPPRLRGPALPSRFRGLYRTPPAGALFFLFEEMWAAGLWRRLKRSIV